MRSTIVSFEVKVSVPQFHHSTDGYIGDTVTTVFRSQSYDAAAEYCFTNCNDHEGYGTEWDAPRAYIMMRVSGYEGLEPVSYAHYMMSDLHVNSSYSGVSDWTEVSF
jgi:hypothetical protein